MAVQGRDLDRSRKESTGSVSGITVLSARFLPPRVGVQAKTDKTRKRSHGLESRWGEAGRAALRQAQGRLDLNQRPHAPQARRVRPARCTETLQVMWFSRSCGLHGRQTRMHKTHRMHKALSSITRARRHAALLSPGSCVGSTSSLTPERGALSTPGTSGPGLSTGRLQRSLTLSAAPSCPSTLNLDRYLTDLAASMTRKGGHAVLIRPRRSFGTSRRLPSVAKPFCEEPGAVVPHARICWGAGGIDPAGLPDDSTG
jgi:hypothetical protein